MQHDHKTNWIHYSFRMNINNDTVQAKLVQN